MLLVNPTGRTRHERLPQRLAGRRRPRSTRDAAGDRDDALRLNSLPDAFEIVAMHLGLMGRVVLSVALMGHADRPRGARFLCSDGDESTAEKQWLDLLHYRKIDRSNGIFVVNVGGYIGSSTTREIEYAERQGKTVEYLFPRADAAGAAHQPTKG